MRLNAATAASALIVAAFASLAAGGGLLAESGPVPSFTGAPAIAGLPAEGDCTTCHLSAAGGADNLNTPGGAIEILDLPGTYDAGATYRLRVRLATDSTAAYPGRKWGFQLTAVRAGDGEGIGTFVLDDAESLAVTLGSDGFFPELASRRYVQQKSAGTRVGLGGPVEWTFSWRAPDAPGDTVFFYGAGNAANGDQSGDGDFVFTARDTVLDATTPARPVTWGEVKRRYRN